MIGIWRYTFQVIFFVVELVKIAVAYFHPLVVAVFVEQVFVGGLLYAARKRKLGSAFAAYHHMP